MPNHHFISYSRVEGEQFAIHLCDKLTAGPPKISIWLDKREIKPADDWDEQISDAISTCKSLLFVMTKDSVKKKSICKKEWMRAIKCKKPIVPLLLDNDAEMPFRLEGRQYINFATDFETALAKLRNFLNWLDSPKGIMQGLKDRLEDADRELARAGDEMQKNRIKDDIASLEMQIAEQQRIIDDPEGEKTRQDDSIKARMESERAPQRPVAGVSRTKFINSPPMVAPIYFQDRSVETNLVGDFLKDDATRLICIVGRAGIGKTAMVCRLLKFLEGGELPDKGGKLPVDGIVYLDKTRLKLPNIYTDLCKMLPADIAQELEQTYKNPKASTEDQMRALLETFPRGRVVVLMDNFEDLLDHENRSIQDTELDDALRSLLNLPHHAVNMILTSRIAPRDLLLVQPGRQTRLDLDEGLPSPFAENILREMDVDGKVGLKNAPNELLDEARQRTLGNPRGLEALFAILSADRETTLREILDDAEKLLPENVVNDLVGEAFSRLDSSAQMVMQMLAIYNSQVTATAVDYLLQPYLPGLDSSPVLNRLANMHFVRKEAGRYYLHQTDREYALSKIPKGDESDREETDNPPFNQYALMHRAAEYFKQVRLPREEWKTIEDLTPQLVEFDLRCSGKDYDKAAQVLLEIDFNCLLVWGHYRLMVQQHERLLGKIIDPDLTLWSVGNLGSAYWHMGQANKAITYYELALDGVLQKKDRDGEVVWRCNLGSAYRELGDVRKGIEYHEQALAISRDIGDRYGEGYNLGNLGSAYRDLGDVRRGIEYYEQALAILREIEDRGGEGKILDSLGNAYSELGDLRKSIKYHEQALVISRDIGDRFGEGTQLGNLGLDYSQLGDLRKSIKYHEQALAISREIGARTIESAALTHLGDAFAHQGNWENAVQYCYQAVQIADEIENVQNQIQAREGLAVAYLYSGDLSSARTTVESARNYDYPTNNHNISALLALVKFRQGDLNEANQSFAQAVNQADEMLAQNDHNYDALDAKGLALCGLALCGDNEEQFRAAKESYRVARAIIKEKGIVESALRLFDALAVSDSRGILKDVRLVASGEQL